MKRLLPFEIKYIVYHADCIDGLTAAAIAYDFDRIDNRYSYYDYIPMKAGELPVKILQIKGENILFLDVSPKKSEFDQIIQNDNGVLILDHHKTAEEELKNVPEENKIFNMEKSGASLSMTYFYSYRNYRNTLDSYCPHPDSQVDDILFRAYKLKGIHEVYGWRYKMTKFVELVEDRDLWRFKYGDETKFLFSALCARLNHIVNDSNSKIPMMAEYFFRLDELLSEGKLLIEEDNKYISKMIEKGVIKEVNEEIKQVSGFENSKLFYVEAETFKLCSEVGNEALNKFSEIDFSLLVYPEKNQFNEIVYKYSLRSRNNKDVSEIGKKFGGGGHKQAAGFTLKEKMVF